jgi:hypothetical protein
MLGNEEKFDTLRWEGEGVSTSKITSATNIEPQSSAE